MKRSELKNARFFAGNKGGNLVCVAPDGEVKWQLGIVAQIRAGAELMAFVDPDDTLKLEGQLSALIMSGNRVTSQRSPDAFKSGANPDFTPTNYTAAEVRMRKLLRDVQEQSDALERRQKSFSAAADTAAEKKAERQAEREAERKAERKARRQAEREADAQAEAEAEAAEVVEAEAEA